MTHAPYGEIDLHGFVDGQIKPERGAALAAWLAAQPQLRHRVEAWKRQNEALKTMFAGVVLEPVPARLGSATLAKECELRPAPGTSRRDGPRIGLAQASAGEPPRRRSIAARAGFGVATFLIGAALTFGVVESGFASRVWGGARPPDLPGSSGHALATRAAEAHQTFATDLNRPVEIPASDETHLLKWIQHRLAMPIRIPDLKAQGWTLLGGRIVPGELGPAAFLVYGNGVERLGLYVARTNAAGSDGFTVSENGTGPGSVAAWIDEPFGYALTTSRDSNWLVRNGAALYGSVRAQARDNASAF